MIGFIDTSLQLQSITTAYSQWPSKTRSILYWTTSVGLVIGFINQSQVVTTINYNTVPDFYTTNDSTLIFSVYLHLAADLNTGIITRSIFQYYT
jgi:hypothetical protein